MTRSILAKTVEVAEVISRELDEDYVGVWKIAWHLRRALPDASDSEIRELALAILQGLEASDVVVGDLSGDSGLFTAWEPLVSADEVERRWLELGRDPNIGEVGWLARRR